MEILRQYQVTSFSRGAEGGRIYGRDTKDAAMRCEDHCREWMSQDDNSD